MSIVYDADTSKADAKIDQVLANTMVAMEDVENLEADNKRVDEIVEATVTRGTDSLRKTVAGARQVAQIIRGLAVASGGAINEIYIIGIEAALLTAELLIDIQTAASFSVLGVVSAIAKTGQVIALLQKANQLRQGQTEAAARTEGIISSMGALSALTYLVLPGPILIGYIIYLLGAIL